MDGVLGKLGGTGSLVGRGARLIRGRAVSAAMASWRAVKGLVPERASTTAEEPLLVSLRALELLSCNLEVMNAVTHALNALAGAVVVQQLLSAL